MTKQKQFKRRVRARMDKTGESYTAARRQLIDASEAQPAPAFEPTVAEERLTEATGHGWDHWLAVLDEWDGASKSHGEIARHLIDDLEVPGWYAQSITVGYERARGLRVKGQGRDGTFSASVSRTVAVPAEQLFAAFEEGELRDEWLPGAHMSVRTVTPPRLGRWDWEDGATRVVLGIEALTDGRSRLGLTHERLPDAETAEEVKAFWRSRATTLKELLEGRAES